MHPPKVIDEIVVRLIRDLTLQGALPSGALVRRALGERYRSRGGVARIYRLLASERARVGNTGLSPVGAGLLEVENANLRDQLKALRQREDAQQTYWNRQVAQLRARIEALESAVNQAGHSDPDTAALRVELQRAEIRVGQLEVGVRTFGPASNRKDAGG